MMPTTPPAPVPMPAPPFDPPFAVIIPPWIEMLPAYFTELVSRLSEVPLPLPMAALEPLADTVSAPVPLIVRLPTYGT